MAKISRPPVALPPAPEKYDPRAENEFRRLVAQYLSDPVEDLVRPSLAVSVEVAATEYTITVTWTGTMTYTIDGGADVAGTTSPQEIVVARNAYLGATKAYVFKVVLNGQTVASPVNVPAVETNAAAAFEIDDPQTANATTDVYSYAWTVSGMPSGTTYNLLYRYTNTAGTLVEEGTVTNATSGGTIASAGVIGASPTYTMTVNAVNAGATIATLSKVGIFTT